MEIVKENVFSLDKARKEKVMAQRNKNFSLYIKKLANSDLQNEINFFLENFPAQSNLTADYAYRGTIILYELAARTTDAFIKKSICSMAQDLEGILCKIS